MIIDTYSDKNNKERQAILLCSECSGVIRIIGDNTVCDPEEGCRQIEGKTYHADLESWENDAPIEVEV